ncbi:hypothetical protein ASG11_07765 [Sphingomonas sp. Leaf357]|nr:hypothetical protein ASG11_07765 [Sphingomonas sp. Leaf357]
MPISRSVRESILEKAITFEDVSGPIGFSYEFTEASNCQRQKIANDADHSRKDCSDADRGGIPPIPG